MRAFHTLWTRPYAAREPGLPFDMADFDLFCMALSALEWRAENGSVSLVTDSVGARYVCAYGLDSLWDGGVSRTLDDVPSTVDPSTFWAAGKLFALSAQTAPCVMLDTDFIVWDDLSDVFSRSELAVIHREGLNPDIYPDPSGFVCAEGYRYPDSWDFSLSACNTAFCYIGSEALRERYCEDAINFIGAVRDRHPLHYMVFAEQRILPMCADTMGVRTDSLSDLGQLFSAGQRSYTHLWGYKGRLISSPGERAAFCSRCAERIRRDFPEAVSRLRIHPKLARYL